MKCKKCFGQSEEVLWAIRAGNTRTPSISNKAFYYVYFRRRSLKATPAKIESSFYSSPSAHVARKTGVFGNSGVIGNSGECLRQFGRELTNLLGVCKEMWNWHDRVRTFVFRILCVLAVGTGPRRRLSQPAPAAGWGPWGPRRRWGLGQPPTGSARVSSAAWLPY